MCLGVILNLFTSALNGGLAPPTCTRACCGIKSPGSASTPSNPTVLGKFP